MFASCCFLVNSCCLHLGRVQEEMNKIANKWHHGVRDVQQLADHETPCSSLEENAGPSCSIHTSTMSSFKVCSKVMLSCESLGS